MKNVITYADHELHLKQRKEKFIARGARPTEDQFIVQVAPGLLYDIQTDCLIAKDAKYVEVVLRFISRRIARMGDSENIPRTEVVRVRGDANHLALVTFYPSDYDDSVIDLLERFACVDDRSVGATHNID